MDLPWPSAGGAPAESQPRRYPLGDGGNLWVYDVGLACCAVEFVAASVRHEFAAAGYSPYPAALRDAQILVVSGTVTDKIAPEVVRAYAEVPDPKYVISFGSCANSGGPYWDSYSVTKGVDQLIPVDVYVPGCPPRPESLLDGLKKLRSAYERP